MDENSNEMGLAEQTKDKIGGCRERMGWQALPSVHEALGTILSLGGHNRT